MPDIVLLPDNDRSQVIDFDLFASEPSRLKTTRQLLAAILLQAIRDGMSFVRLRIVRPDGDRISMQYGFDDAHGSHVWEMRPPPVEMWASLLKVIFAETQLGTSWPLAGDMLVRVKRMSRTIRISVPAIDEICLSWDVAEFTALCPAIVHLSHLS